MSTPARATVEAHDPLVAAIRARVADADRRVELRPSALLHQIGQMDLGAMVAMVRDLQGGLADLLAAPLEPPPHVVDQASALAGLMAEPAAAPLVAPCPEGVVADAEAHLGFPLPPLLHRLYTEVANGGFGPGYGIIGLPGGWTDDHDASIVELHDDLAGGALEDQGLVWPDRLVPVCHLGDGEWACVACGDPAGPVVRFDPSALGDPEDGWDDEGADGPVLAPLAPSLAAWLRAWLDAPVTAWAPDVVVGPQAGDPAAFEAWLRDQGHAGPHGD